MQRKFRLVEPRDTSIEKWVTVSDDLNVSNSNDPFKWIASPRVSVDIPINVENDIEPVPVLTPTTIKVANKPVFFSDDFTGGPPIRVKRKRKRSPIPQPPENNNFKVKYNSTGLVKNSKQWKPDTTRDSSRSGKLNLSGQSQKSLLSCSSEGGLDSSRVLFKTEIKNVEADKLVTVVNKDGNKTEERIPPTFSARENENLIPDEMAETILQPRIEPDKVDENRKEIEKLKNEIDELIKTNIKDEIIKTKDKNVTTQQETNENVENIPSNPNLTKAKPIFKQNTVVITSPPKTIKSPISARRKQSNTSVDATPHKEEPKLKSKSYDPESTREFIKKQKQRRKEKLQQEQSKKKEEEELKKQKLKQLEERTTKLIADNVKKSLNKRTKSDEKLSPQSPNATAQPVNKNKNSVNVPQNNRLRARSFDRVAERKQSEESLKTKAPSTARSRSASRDKESKICDKKPPGKLTKPTQKKMPVKPKPLPPPPVLNPEEDLINVMAKIDKELKKDELNNNKEDILKKSQSKVSLASIAEKSEENSDSKSEHNINLVKIAEEPKESVVPQQKVEEVSIQKIETVVVDEDSVSAMPLNMRLERIKNNLENMMKPIEIPQVVHINEIQKDELPTKLEVAQTKLETAQKKLQYTQPTKLEVAQTTKFEVAQLTKLEAAQKTKSEVAQTTKFEDAQPTILEHALKDIEEIKQKLETNITESNLEDRKNETPAWLLPPSSLPYPYNFISAVRKKLEIATKGYSISPMKQDTSIQTMQEKEQSSVSIQCSLAKRDVSIPEIIPPKPEELQTFSSHKCRKQLVYDSPPKLKSPKKFKEIIKELPQKPLVVEKKDKSLVKSEFVPESDTDTTFQDIPELPEEEQFVKSKSEAPQVKNITFVRQSQINGENFSFEQLKVDKNSLNKKNKVDNRLKNITFNRQTSNSDINDLIKPDYKIDTSKLSRKSLDHSNRSKYPSDIENILSQYSKMKVSSKTNNGSPNSQYSEDFNSSPCNNISQLSKSYDQYPEKSSLNVPTETRTSTKINSSEIAKIKTEILASLAKKHSSTALTIPEESECQNSDFESVVLSNGTRLSKRSIEKILEALNKKSPVRSYISERESRNSSRTSQIKSKTGHSEPISDVQTIPEQESNKSKSRVSDKSKKHSKKEESYSIPESSAIRTESIPESSIKSNKSFIEDAKSDLSFSSIHSKTEKNESSKTKSALTDVPSLTKPEINLKIGREKFFQEVQSLLDIDQTTGAKVTFRRGCGAPEQIESLSVLEPSVCSLDLSMSQMSESMASEMGMSVNETQNENDNLTEASIGEKNANPYVGVSLGMFDQMIRDENNRLEYLKAFLKLRDKALFDRTKGELALLEIQKKQLRENGQLTDVTVIKKKQRGLLIKLEQERHEMQRLKQAHKQASKERKNALRKQKNIIKQQLSSTDQIPSKIRRLSQADRRQSGPIKVYRVESRAEQVREATMSRNSSGDETTVSLVTTSSVVTHISEKVTLDTPLALKSFPKISRDKAVVDKQTEKVKRALLMKEADLEKRRKDAEEVIKWNERLKQEEAAVLELERQANSIQLDDPEKKRVLTGAQLNKIWKGITGTTLFDDHKKYQMSKRSLDKFYQNARKIFKEISEERNSSKRASEESYTSDFDSPAVHSTITQNDSDTNISPNKMLSERLRKISEATRLDIIASSKKDTNTSFSSNKKSIVSEILPTDNLSELETLNSKESSEEISSVVSGIESIISKKSIQSVISRKSSTRSEIPEIQSPEKVQSIEESIRESTKSQMLSEIKQDLINETEIVESVSSDSDLPELEIVTEQIKSIDTNDSVDNIKSELEENASNADIISVISPKSEKATTVSTEELKLDESEQKSSSPQESEIKSDNNEMFDRKMENEQISEILSQNKDTISEKVSPVQTEENITPVKSDNTSSIVNENILSKLETVRSELELKSVVSTNSEIEEISKVEENLNKSQSEMPESILSKSEIVQSEAELKSVVSTNSEIEEISKVEENLHKSNSDMPDSILSKSEIVQSEQELKSVIGTISEIEEIGKAEENLNKSQSEMLESILSKSETVQKEQDLKSVISTISEIEEIAKVEENLENFNKSQSEMMENILSKSETVQSEPEIKSISTISEIEEIGKVEENLSKSYSETPEKISQHDKSSESKSSSTDDYPVHYRSEFEQYNESFSEQSDIKTPESDELSTKPSAKSEFETDFIKSLSFEPETEKILDETLQTEKSLLEELELAKSTEKSVSKDSVASETEPKVLLSKSQSEEEIISSAKEIISFALEKLSSESPEESKVEHSETETEENLEIPDQKSESQDKKSEKESIDSELATPIKSEPDNENKSETGLTSETKESSEKSDFENDQSFENESEAITESKDTETFMSEKESTTVIESPKSTKENEIKSPEENSVVESQESKKSSVEYSVDENKENSFVENKEYSIHEDKNVSGVSHIDVRKRVSEILADTNSPRGDYSPRVQDLYVTTYDVATNSPEGTPETGSPTNEYKKDKSVFPLKTPYRNEAEELLRKQLEIEQEIIQLERQQQQNIPYLFMREIPNKPPPPYKPPTAVVTRVINSVIPAASDQIRSFVRQATDVLFQAYIAGNLKDITFYEDGDKVTSQKFIFDLCKEIALDICKPTENIYLPSWKSQKNKFHSLISRKPLNKEVLCSVMNKKVLQLLNFEPVIRKDNLIIRWSRKKRDHVDEILVLESQTEETEWTNYDSDEQTIKENLTSDIMNMLISETAQAMCEILNRKKTLSWINYC